MSEHTQNTKKIIKEKYFSHNNINILNVHYIKLCLVNKNINNKKMIDFNINFVNVRIFYKLSGRYNEIIISD